MSRWSDGLGRTIIIAGVAGALFAGFLALAPRLTAGDTATASTTTLPAPAASTSLPGISDPVVAVPGTSGDIAVTVTTEPPTTTTTTTVAATADADSPTTTSTPPLDGLIELSVDARSASNAHPDGLIVEGDQIQWRFTLRNVSDEELWGAYVFLELHGPAECEDHNLEPGEATDCWIATTAVEGTHTAEVWGTAWTLDRIVMDEMTYTFEVTS